jgi:hypothetical protein
MRRVFLLWIVLCWDVGVRAQAPKDTPPRRYGIEANLRDYPQETPKETLASVLQAIERGRINYLLAHLADPAFVDNRVKVVYGGDFEELVRETTSKLADNPNSVKELQRFLKEGEWEAGDTSASVKLKDTKDRQVFFRKIGRRWFLENRQKSEPAKTEP